MFKTPFASAFQLITFTMSDKDVKLEEEHRLVQDEANDDEVRDGPFRTIRPSSSRNDGGSSHGFRAIQDADS